MITHDYDIEPELLKTLADKYRSHVVKNAWDGLDAIAEAYFDVFVVFSNDHSEAHIEAFFNELEKMQALATPIILVSENPSEALQTKAHQNAWYLFSRPINLLYFMTAIDRSVHLANALDQRTIILEKGGHKYKYRIRDIQRVQKSRDRNVLVYSVDALTGKEIAREFFFKHALSRFPAYYGIEKQLKQAQQSWLVNAFRVTEIRTNDMELVLDDGTVVPTSKKYMRNFMEIGGDDAHES